MIKFPESLPRPQRDDYEFTPVNNIMRTPMESGRAVQRDMWDEVPSTLAMSFIFSHTEARLFDAWANQVAKSNWFLFKVYDVIDYDDERECRFMASPGKPTPVGVTHWRYTCQIEIRVKPEMMPDWAEVLPDYILQSDIFDIAVNKLMPLNDWQTYIELFDETINSEWPKP